MDLVRALIDKQIKESLSIVDGIFENCEDFGGTKIRDKQK